MDLKWQYFGELLVSQHKNGIIYASQKEIGKGSDKKFWEGLESWQQVGNNISKIL